MFKFKRWWLIGIWLSGVSAPARADIVYSQDPNLLSVLFVSDSTSVLGLQQADNFTLGSAASIQAVTFYGKWTSVAQPPESFTVRFFEDMGGTPNVNPTFEFTSLAPDSRDSVEFLPPLLSVFHYGINLPAPVNLNAGTTYYFSVVNTATNAFGDWGWLGTDLLGSTRFQRNDDGVLFTSIPDADLTFALMTNAMLEPSPVLLGGTAMLASGAWRLARARLTILQ